MPTHRIVFVRLIVLAVLGLALAGCKHNAPYRPGQGPSAEDLIATTAPRLDAIQVANARVVVNRAARGDLAFIAQAPGRFRGGVEFKGNELVTLAFDEDGYALRYKMDQLAPGFYAGPPPADCAVEALLGLRFPTDGLVSLVLGGAPVIAAPYETVEQAWSRDEGYERLVIRNAQYIQELRFNLVGGGWHLVGSVLWENAGGSKGLHLWEIEHGDLQRIGDVVLPERTRIMTPGKRRDNLVVIIYHERNTSPAFARGPTDADGDDGADDGAAADEGTPPGDDWGGDDGWENEDDAAPAGDGAEPSKPSDAEPPTPAVAQPQAAPAKPQSKVPGVFKIDATGLTPRGDLCR